MTIKERIYREWLTAVLFVRIFMRNVTSFRLKFLLFVYAFTLLVLGDYVSEIHRGDNPISPWLWLPAICFFLHLTPLYQELSYHFLSS